MAQMPIELILARHWASYMAIPIWIYGPDGTLVFYNESAEALLARSFDEEGEINADELAELFDTTSLDGEPLEADELPIVRALAERVPAHLGLRIKRSDGKWLAIEATAFPIEGQGGRHLGAMSTFWEMSPP